MKIQLVGGSYQEWSLPANAERSVNLYPISDPEGADVSSLYGTPGLKTFTTLGTGPIRGVFRSAANSRAFAVSGSGLYELHADGTSTLRGSLNGSSGTVTIAENGLQLGICDGDKLYMFTYLTNVFGVVTDPDLPSAGGIDFIDGYFVINENNTGRFYISALYDGTSWDPLDFATAESSPDKLVRAINFVGQLGLYGEKTLEIWRNTGDSLFPFARISSATPIGATSAYAIQSIDTSIFWVGGNDQGTGIVYKASGFSPVRISTSPIERILQGVNDLTALVSWAYQEDGHVFYVITGSDLETSLVFDLNTNLWHERAYLSNGDFQQHRACCFMEAFNKHLVGDRADGRIYEMSQDFFTDDGDPIKRLRVYTHLLDELNPVRYSSLQIGFEVGDGLQSGQGSDPIMSLRISKDGARTWTAYYNKSLGAVGKYQQQVKFRRLGIQQQNTYEISTSEPIKIAITGSYLN